mmetsp:Transcript_3130/g.5324  ORF Transcript_3130/g.5324 Transcript_3130/m.5324 type:complete len:198 (+) Transcript_3130:137-730(+)
MASQDKVEIVTEPEQDDETELQNLSPQHREVLAQLHNRVSMAMSRRADLQKEGEALKNENLSLKKAVEKAQKRAERRILKKRAENVQLMAENAELEYFKAEARRLKSEKEKLTPEINSQEWEALKVGNETMRRRLQRAISRPERTPLGMTMASPRSDASTPEATPRIEAVRQWSQTIRSLSPNSREQVTPVASQAAA